MPSDALQVKWTRISFCCFIVQIFFWEWGGSFKMFYLMGFVMQEKLSPKEKKKKDAMTLLKLVNYDLTLI